MPAKTEKEFFALCLEFLKRSPIYQDFLQNPTSDDPQFRGVKHLHGIVVRHSRKLSPYPSARIVDSAEYAARMGGDMERALSIFRTINKKDPSPEELITESCKLAGAMGKNTVYIKVQVTSIRTAMETRAAIDDCVKIAKGMIVEDFRRDILEQLGYPDFTKNAIFPKLWRYLGVYDRKLTGEPWEKIAVFMGKKQSARKGCFEHPKEPDKDFDDLDLTREIRRDFTNAKKIISNVEGGIFPGDF